MSTRINRRALAAGILAATAAPAIAKGTHQTRTLRGDDTVRLLDHAALWARMPLPFTPAEAWHLLSPATQAEIGAAVIGMVLSETTFRSHTCIIAGFLPGAHVRGVGKPLSDIDPSSGTERRSGESVQKSDAKP